MLVGVGIIFERIIVKLVKDIINNKLIFGWFFIKIM